MYANMKRMYDKAHPAMWTMAVAYLLSNGFETVEQITDEEIATVKENGLMTQEFAQDLVRLARDMAKECGSNVVELIQFCEIEKPFDTKFYKAKRGA